MGYEAFPVRSSRPRPQIPHDVPIKKSGEVIGYLCLLRGLEGEVAALTDAQKEAFNKDSFGVQVVGDCYFFKSDYVVIHNERLGEYNEVKFSSAFWGQYLHEADAPHESPARFNGEEVIQVNSGCSFPTHRHAESLYKYASYGRPTDRFLFLYHFLELDFDREVVLRIKSLEDEDLNGVGRIIKDLGGGEELSRLAHVIREMPIDEIQDHAGALKDHVSVCGKIFYEYGKDSNPVKQYEDFISYFVDTTAVRESIFKEISAGKNPKKKVSVDLAKNFKESMRKCSAYWIYRVRCCVAHNKLGEYHLMSAEDMDFLECFAIPLLRSIVGYRMTRN